MPVAIEERVPVFTSQVRELIGRYGIRKDRRTEHVDGQRVAYLVSNVLVKIYGAKIGHDAYICIRDWALKNKIRCDRILEMEMRHGKEVKCPYSTSVKRVYENLSFDKYTNILSEILAPKRRPLRGRTPLTHLQA